MFTRLNEQLGLESRRRGDLIVPDSLGGIASELERIAATVEYLYWSSPFGEPSLDDALHSLHRAIAALREADNAVQVGGNAEQWIG